MKFKVIFKRDDNTESILTDVYDIRRRQNYSDSMVYSKKRR
jgi:hypothetical protein